MDPHDVSQNRSAVDAFGRKHRTGVVTLVFTDIVGSTQLKQALGDGEGVARIQSHHARVRQLLAGFPEAQEIGTAGDSFFLIFVKPSDAVRFAVRLQHELRENARKDSHPVRDRIGIHVGEVIFDEGPGGTKDLLGMQVDTCARLMALGDGDQILLTRFAFESARQALSSEPAGDLAALTWLSHGHYEVKGVDGRIEVFEVGEAGRARLRPPERDRQTPPTDAWKRANAEAPRPRITRRMVLYALIAFVVLGLMTLALWEPTRQLLLRRELRGNQCLLVLPLNPSDSGDSQALVQGGAVGDLTERLMRLEASRSTLRVVSTSERLSEQVRSPRQARERCAATLVLEVRFYQEAGRRFLSLSLVRTRTIERLYATALPLQGDDPLAFLDGAEQAVVGWLEVDLSRRPSAPVKARSNAQASELYLEGFGALERFDRQENRDKAITCFRAATKAAPDFALAFARLGEALAREFEVSRLEPLLGEARSACTNALRIDPRLSYAHYSLGLIARAAGQRQEAIGAFARACALDEFHHDATREWARTLVELNRLDEAQRRYDDAINRNPSDWAGYNQLGVLYVRKGDNAAAERAFRKVIALASDSYMGYRNLGGVLHNEGRYEEAVGYCEKSIQIKPNAEAYSNLGTIEFFHRRRYLRAAELFDHATGLQPGNYTLWGNLGDACRYVPSRSNDMVRAYTNAIHLATEELERDPGNPETLANLATYHSGLGNHTPALPIAEQALAQDPASKDIQFLAALVFERAGQRARALKAIDRAVELEYSPIEITNHPDLAGLRGDPAFSPIAARLGAVNPTDRK